jgi:hypothetical protein
MVRIDGGYFMGLFRHVNLLGEVFGNQVKFWGTCRWYCIGWLGG